MGPKCLDAWRKVKQTYLQKHVKTLYKLAVCEYLVILQNIISAESLKIEMVIANNFRRIYEIRYLKRSWQLTMSLVTNASSNTA